MEIAQIKQRLDIIQVASTLGLSVNKDGKALCPFHNDTEPSLQFSEQKQICTCFSSNCDAGTMDVIALTEKYLKVSTHEALNYLTSLAGGKVTAKPKNGVVRDYTRDFEKMKSSFAASSTARNYAKDRKLDRALLQLGYNGKKGRFDYLKGCMVFSLRDEKGKTVSLYGRNVEPSGGKHFYTPDRKGLYPSYPRPKSSRVILTESVIDAATLLSCLDIASNYEVLALYGTNGLTSEHVKALQQLNLLEEIILFFDGDEAGIAALEKQSKFLHGIFSDIALSKVQTPENQDINSIATANNYQELIGLIDKREAFSFSIEVKQKKEVLPKKEVIDINSDNPNNITFITGLANYSIKGGIGRQLDSMKVTLVVEHPENLRKSRNKADLFDDRLVSKTCREIAERLSLRADLLERDINLFTDLLDNYRESLMEKQPESQEKPVVPVANRKECLEFLKAPELLKRINALIGESGVVGEENNRIFLFCIASSFKMIDTLHALIQGSSGSGKTHLLSAILSMMPEEDVITLTRVTESSFYNYGEYDLQFKIIGLEDFDGLEEKAELAFRELQSRGMISSSTTVKDENTGIIAAKVKYVYGPIASLAATTKGEIYEDNMSRCFLIAVDESHEQTMRIIRHQNRASAGHVDKSRCTQIKEFLQDCIRLLEPLEVINPYADKIELPQEAHKIRRLNSLFQCFVRQITLLNQFQRQRDNKGRLITDKEDIREAIRIMFESIILKVDELDGSLRGFYERLKEYVNAKGKEYEFGQREVRQAFKVSKSQLQRYVNQLLELEYINKTYVSARNTYHYKISYWDNMKALRDRISKDLNDQLDQL